MHESDCADTAAKGGYGRRLAESLWRMMILIGNALVLISAEIYLDNGNLYQAIEHISAHD
jgi:hypothetical protein